ncbi:hypothetical protein [Paenibacillus rigui]|uniref:Uncharacterized protein n=1 Tax=Paenibacillus rigui TaxID=554312 RepID=A0A229UGQ3_9BACL|nr:hypothetical protein [Paenibacillus rigui]OXM82525.1 hypothetical protein CF651_30540 [Paenibacillus rigui]
MRSPFWYKIALVFSAYLPLFFVFVLKLINFDNLDRISVDLKFMVLHFNEFISKSPQVLLLTISNFLLIISLLSCFFVSIDIITTQRRRIGAKQIEIKKVISREQDVLTYIATYILPLVSLNLNTWNDAWVSLFLLILILWLSLRSEMLYINPLLFALGYHIYSVETEKGNVLYISKNKQSVFLKQSSRMCYRLEGESILLDGSEKG